MSRLQSYSELIEDNEEEENDNSDSDQQFIFSESLHDVLGFKWIYYICKSVRQLKSMLYSQNSCKKYYNVSVAREDAKIMYTD